MKSIPGQIYFIFVLYSYAAHLRTNTYHSLPLSSSSPNPNRRTSVDEWASTAPVHPTHPAYRGSLDDGLTIDQALHPEHRQNQSGNSSKHNRPSATQLAAQEQGEEVFNWDSDEEEPSKGKKTANEAHSS